MPTRLPVTREVVYVPPSLLIANCWSIMQDKRIRHLPVVHDGKLAGILSDRDLLRVANVLPDGELGFVRRHAGDIMTLNPTVCAPDTSVGDAARIMTRDKIDALPVVAGGRLIGLVTSTDLLQLLIDSPEEKLPFEFRIEMVGALPA